MRSLPVAFRKSVLRSVLKSVLKSQLLIAALALVLAIAPQASAQAGSIDLIQCSGRAAKWASRTVTYRIVDVAGTGATAAVQAAIARWNNAQTVYQLQSVTSNEDIRIDLYYKITPGYILGAAAVACTTDGSGAIDQVTITLGVKGLSSVARQNLAGHEIGHGLGLGHANLTQDVLDPRFEHRAEGKRIFCLSNLDVGALSATGTSYSVPDWEAIPCN